MINTKLHNYLIEKDMEQKSVLSQMQIESLRSELLKQRLKNYAYIALFVFFILLLFILLLKILPMNINGFNNPFALNSTTDIKTTAPSFSKHNNQDELSKDKEPVTLKNGIDYIKENNLVYKREWEDGVLVQKTKLASTIKESQKLEDIPKFSHEKGN